MGTRLGTGNLSPKRLRSSIIVRSTWLLTDLNIGGPADGFILVSAMRRVQCKAATFILTGYPDFQTALEAIRKQVDDYFVD